MAEPPQPAPFDAKWLKIKKWKSGWTTHTSVYWQQISFPLMQSVPAVMPNLNQYCLNMILRPFSATVVKPGKSLLEIAALKAQEDSQKQVLLNAVHSKIQNKAYINNIQKHYSLLWVMNVWSVLISLTLVSQMRSQSKPVHIFFSLFLSDTFDLSWRCPPTCTFRWLPLLRAWKQNQNTKSASERSTTLLVIRTYLSLRQISLMDHSCTSCYDFGLTLTLMKTWISAKLRKRVRDNKTLNRITQVTVYKAVALSNLLGIHGHCMPNNMRNV